MPAESTLGGIAEMLEGIGRGYFTEDAMTTQARCEAAAARLRSLDGVLADLPKAPWRDENDRQTYTPYPGERRAYGEALDDWARRLRAVLSGEPATEGRET